jgi:hypothetical protein
MPEFETIGPDNWKDFVEAKPAAMLVIGKHDCDHCNSWSAELVEFLAGEGAAPFKEVRFGKIDLKQRGLIEFRKATPFLKDLDVLPYNVIYVNGEPAKQFAGAGVERMTNRLKRVLGEG